MTSSIAIQPSTALEQYFQRFREQVIGHNKMLETPFGFKHMKYADWTASGRLYEPIEVHLLQTIAPYIGNTHTETNVTGTSMTVAYHKSKEIIKSHVNANENDVLIMAGSGMTGAVNKFQRILGFKNLQKPIDENDRPVIFVTHLEHHSNDISWRETVADVEIINLCHKGNVNIKHLELLLKKYKDRKFKAAAITACSNVTGIQTPYHRIAEIMHENDGWCFVDFACSAPYVEIDMHPENELAQIDAIYFSMHKFLGGPGTPGVLIFNRNLYNNQIPDNPGGGTVEWVNPWSEQQYFKIDTTAGIEAREDGGTPPFYQTIKSALCVKLKEQMGMKRMMQREEELLEIIFHRLERIPNLHILAENNKDRLGVISFIVEDLHYNLGVKMLNDKYGIQVRGGCACAGPYGHCLLNISQNYSQLINETITAGDMTVKPGWIRMSIHPIMTNAEVEYILDGIEKMASKFKKWQKDYVYQPDKNEFTHANSDVDVLHHQQVEDWFEVKL
jgi:selenocysteine lyase/cysteine desulfurase